MSASGLVTGGQVVARVLRGLGADTVFSVSGNQVLPIFDAAAEAGLRIVHGRHESAAAYAALGFAEASGRPGVVLVSAGPGFLAAATGIATAKSAELPLLFLSGAAAVPEQGAGGFQDLDQASVAAVTCKGSLAAVRVAELEAMLLDAWQPANADVPGPVPVSLPSDVLRATTSHLPASDRQVASFADATTHPTMPRSVWSDLESPRPLDPVEPGSSGGLHPLEVARAVPEVLRADDVIVLDGGEYCQWIRLGLKDVPNRMLWNGKLGGIGGGLPMALGVAAAGLGGRTIAFVGDGAFGYHAAELETAARYGFPLVVIVGNDGRWGAEWHLQVSRYGSDRAFETSLLPADYDAVGRGLGALGIRAVDAATLRDALASAIAGRRPVCINAHIRSIRSPAPTH